MIGVRPCDKCHSEYYNRKKMDRSRTPPLLNFKFYVLDYFEIKNNASVHFFYYLKLSLTYV